MVHSPPSLIQCHRFCCAGAWSSNTSHNNCTTWCHLLNETNNVHYRPSLCRSDFLRWISSWSLCFSSSFARFLVMRSRSWSRWSISPSRSNSTNLSTYASSSSSFSACRYTNVTVMTNWRKAWMWACVGAPFFFLSEVQYRQDQFCRRHHRQTRRLNVSRQHHWGRDGWRRNFSALGVVLMQKSPRRDRRLEVAWYTVVNDIT